MSQPSNQIDANRGIRESLQGPSPHYSQGTFGRSARACNSLGGSGIWRQTVDDYLKVTGKAPGDFLFTGRRGKERCLTTRQYARLLSEWIAGIGLDSSLFGTHSIRRTKATLIYRRTGNLRAVQLLLGHTKVESTVRYLGVEVDDALTIAEQVDI